MIFPSILISAAAVLIYTGLQETVPGILLFSKPQVAIELKINSKLGQGIEVLLDWSIFTPKKA